MGSQSPNLALNFAHFAGLAKAEIWRRLDLR